jgi:hypothetical protein
LFSLGPGRPSLSVHTAGGCESVVISLHDRRQLTPGEIVLWTEVAIAIPEDQTIGGGPLDLGGEEMIVGDIVEDVSR